MQQCTLVRMHLGAYRVYYNEGLKTDEEANQVLLRSDFGRIVLVKQRQQRLVLCQVQ